MRKKTVWKEAANLDRTVTLYLDKKFSTFTVSSIPSVTLPASSVLYCLKSTSRRSTLRSVWSHWSNETYGQAVETTELSHSQTKGELLANGASWQTEKFCRLKKEICFACCFCVLRLEARMRTQEWTNKTGSELPFWRFQLLPWTQSAEQVCFCEHGLSKYLSKWSI